MTYIVSDDTKISGKWSVDLKAQPVSQPISQSVCTLQKD